MEPNHPEAKGRGSQIDPPNRFGLPYCVPDLEQVAHDAEYLDGLHNRPTEYLPDRSRTVVTENDSPDIGFRYSVNPYRGCSHGCSYCYARQTHEYLGLSAGLDFETKIFVKESAPDLFRDFLARERWQPEPIALSGVTDPYQPAERHFLLTRRCIEVAAEGGGKLNDSTFGTRMCGTGEMARQIAALFRLFAAKHGLDGGLPPYDCTKFRPPRSASGQLWLF